MQYLILFLAIALLGVALVVGFRPRPATARRAEGGASMLGLYEPDPVLPPVLLPEHPRGADVDGLRLSPALRGYRCEQVDGVLDALAGEIERLHGELESLKAPRELSEAESAELLAAWGPQEGEQPGQNADTPANVAGALAEDGAPASPSEEPLVAQESAAEEASGAVVEPAKEASPRDEEGPFEEESQTFRSV